MTAPQKVLESFDCVEFKRRAQERIFETIKGMSPTEEIEYLRRAAESGPFADFLKKIEAAQSVKEIQANSPNR